MKSKSINDGVERTFVLILDQGEEAFKSITDFAEREKITGASVSAIGAFSKAKVGWFDLAAKKYKPIEVNVQCEVLSLLGDVAQGDDGKASLHLHAVLGLEDGTLRGGHFLSGSVQPTLEVTITETVVHLRRKSVPIWGLHLSVSRFAIATNCLGTGQVIRRSQAGTGWRHDQPSHISGFGRDLVRRNDLADAGVRDPRSHAVVAFPVVAAGIRTARPLAVLHIRRSPRHGGHRRSHHSARSRNSRRQGRRLRRLHRPPAERAVWLLRGSLQARAFHQRHQRAGAAIGADAGRALSQGLSPRSTNIARRTRAASPSTSSQPSSRTTR